MDNNSTLQVPQEQKSYQNEKDVKVLDLIYAVIKKNNYISCYRRHNTLVNAAAGLCGNIEISWCVSG